MSATIELTDEEVADLKSYTNEADAQTAVRVAKSEFLRFVRRMQLKALSGRVQMEDNWKSLEEAELKGQHGDSGNGAR